MDLWLIHNSVTNNIKFLFLNFVFELVYHLIVLHGFCIIVKLFGSEQVTMTDNNMQWLFVNIGFVTLFYYQ